MKLKITFPYGGNNKDLRTIFAETEENVIRDLNYIIRMLKAKQSKKSMETVHWNNIEVYDDVLVEYVNYKISSRNQRNPLLVEMVEE